MNKTYAASELPENEWLVLDALVTAAKEGECPISVEEFWENYASLEDVDEVLDLVLTRLAERGLAGVELGTTRWFPTPRGTAVVEFQEKTAFQRET